MLATSELVTETSPTSAAKKKISYTVLTLRTAGTNMKKTHLNRKVQAIAVKNKTISQLLNEMSRTAYQGRKLGEAVNVWQAMLQEPDLTIVMGLAGSMSTAGQWKIINWLIQNRYIDVLVSTGANISEDIIEAMGRSYWQTSPQTDDQQLLQNDLNRYYDVLGKETDYREMELLMTEALMQLKKDHKYTTAEMLYEFGKHLNKKHIPSITATAAKHKVPIFSPAIADSAYGEAFLMAKNQGHTITLDQIKDFDQFISIGEKTKNIGVIYIGGGVPKDFTQLIAISVSPKTNDKGIQGREGHLRKAIKEYYYPHKYAIQITTDSPQWGGLSGCTLEEAISWGKIDQTGKRAVVYCDATIALPLITHALNEKTKTKRKPPDMSWLFKNTP